MPANKREAEFIMTMLMDLIYYDGVLSDNLSDKEYFYMEQIAVKFDGSLALSEAYEILGADESDGDAEIKKKYRDLVRKYHADNFESKDLPPEMLNFAKEMTQKINAAYETIKNHRGM